MKLVIIVDPITSKIITSLALTDRLREEGHDVSFLVPPGQMDSEALARLGLTVNVADLRIDPPGRQLPADETVLQFQQQLEAEAADLYLLDIEAHEYVLAALGAGLPVGLLNLFFNLWKLPGVPPVHQDVVPGRGWRGSKLGIEYGWLGYRALRSRNIAGSLARRNDRRYLLRTFAEAQGLDSGQTLAELHGLIPFQYRNLQTLTLNLEELELPGAIHPLNHYVGPMPNLSATGMDRAAGDDVMADIDQLRADHPDRRLIYAAFGAYYGGNDLGFWKRAIDAIGRRADWVGVFGLGGRIDPADLGPVPDNVRLYRWAPQLQVLEQADCAVIHAGMTSVYECLHHRVPMVVFPLGDSFDQFGTAARVEYHRLGIVGDRNTATVADVQESIDTVLDDPELATRIERFRKAMDRHRAERTVTAAVQSMIG
jgi:hypothetical protein